MAKETILIIGIGNIGKEYIGTRHNIGFAFIDFLAKKLDPSASFSKKMDAEYCNIFLDQTKLCLIKPTTFVNLSGQAARQWRDFYKLTNEEVYVVYDDISVPLGKIKITNSGSSGGHNGIKSITQHLGAGYTQVKIGLQPRVRQEHGASGDLANQGGSGKSNGNGDGAAKAAAGQKVDLSKFVLGRLGNEETAIINRKIESLASKLPLLLSKSNADRSRLIEAVGTA